MTRILRRAGAIACAAFCCSFSGAAAVRQLWGDESALLRREGDGYRLSRAGAEAALSLPPGASIEGITSLSGRTLIRAVAPARGARANERDLWLGLIEGARWRELPPPPERAAGRSREQAAAVLDAGGDLAGVAWLEGVEPGSFEIRFAPWSARGWGRPEVVAPRGPGSQQALAAATLDDGRALLVWARFDGADDEIVASVREGGRWRTPQPVAADNRVPDIVPAVTAVPGGALAAWNRYDGREYRVVAARWDGTRWSQPAEIGGAGSLFPTIVSSAGRSRVLFQTARPHGWSVVELDTQGRALRRAKVESTSPDRPVLVGDELRWADDRRALLWR